MMNKPVPMWVLSLVLLVGTGAAVIFGWFVRHASEGREKLGWMGPVVMEIANFPTLVQHTLAGLVSDTPLLIENRYPQFDGFKVGGIHQSGAAGDAGYLLLSAYSDRWKQSSVMLIRIRDGEVLYEWVPDIERLSRSHSTSGALSSAQEMTARRYRMVSPILTHDGGLVFHGEQGPLFKIDSCARMQWVVDGAFHHSLERAPDGSYWVPTIAEPVAADLHGPLPFQDHAIAQVSAQGKLLFTKSVSSILEENGYRGLLYGIRKFGRRPNDLDAIHLNDIEPAQYSTPYWNVGDLLLSIRHLSTVLLYRPSTGKVVWLKTGPWLNQHDADFVGPSRISVYGNDMVRKVDDSHVLLDGHNNIYMFEFSVGSVSTPFASVMRDLKVRTEVEGLHRVLANGDAFVEEYGAGRLLRISQSAAVWQFVAKVDERTAGMLSWSRYMMAEEVQHVLPHLAGADCKRTQ